MVFLLWQLQLTKGSPNNASVAFPWLLEIDPDQLKQDKGIHWKDTRELTKLEKMQKHQKV